MPARLAKAVWLRPCACLIFLMIVATDCSPTFMINSIANFGYIPNLEIYFFEIQTETAQSMVTVQPLPSTFAVPVRFPRLPGLTNGKCALSRATLRRRQGVLSRMTSSCLSGTDRLSADAVAVSRHGQFAPDGNPVRQPTQAASASPSGRRGSGGSTGSRPAESSSAAPTPPAAETPGRARRRRR